jgi:hypothetical protein
MTGRVLESFIDDSSDQTQRDVLCVSGFLANQELYKAFEKQWIERLRQDGVRYFRAADCKAVRGSFEHLRKIHGSFPAAKKVADAVRADLEALLVSPSCHWMGFCLGVTIPEYKAVLREFPIATRFYARDPMVAAYTQIMYEVARTVRRKARGFGVAFVVDDSTYSERIRRAFEAMKINHPTIGRSAETCTPSDDKETPALQMADLLASLTRDILLEWLTRGGPHPELGKWYGHIERIGRWDREHMLRSLRRTLMSPRFTKGTLAPQLMPQPKMTKSERKKQRRTLLRKADGRA